MPIRTSFENPEALREALAEFALEPLQKAYADCHEPTRTEVEAITERELHRRARELGLDPTTI